MSDIGERVGIGTKFKYVFGTNKLIFLFLKLLTFVTWAQQIFILIIIYEDECINI